MNHVRKGLMAAGLVGLLGGAAFAQDAPQTAAEKRDARLEKRIEMRFDRDKQLMEHDLDAEVSNGNVTLVGSVRTEGQKRRAEQLARIKGVAALDNQIQILATEDSSDETGQDREGTETREKPTIEPDDPGPFSPRGSEPGMWPSPMDDRPGKPLPSPVPSPDSSPKTPRPISAPR
jgi:hypothetical protein